MYVVVLVMKQDMYYTLYCQLFDIGSKNIVLSLNIYKSIVIYLFDIYNLVLVFFFKTKRHDVKEKTGIIISTVTEI